MCDHGCAEIIDAAYRPARDEAAWLREVLTALRPRLDQGLGVHVRLVEPKEGHAFWITLVDPIRGACFIVAPSTRPIRMSSAVKRRWGQLAWHLSVGLRLQRAATGARSAPSAFDADAVLGALGERRAADTAQDRRAARLALRLAARAVCGAKQPELASGPDEARSLWHALVAGSWSLVDHFDCDGRYLYIARRAAALPSQVLTARERDVARLASLGHSNKLIAYELGLSTTTIATHLARALRKLGLRSRLALIRGAR